MNMFFNCIKFLAVMFVAYSAIKYGHWCLAIFIIIFGGIIANGGNIVNVENCNINKECE